VTRSASAPAMGVLALAVVVALSVAGCACNAPNTFDQRYCEAYSSNTPLPAIAIGVAFFALTVLVWRFMWRRNPADSRPTVDPGVGSTVRASDGSASGVLEPLIASGAVAGRILEGFDGRWIVELTFGTGRETEVFVTNWTDREAACREALEELDRRQPGSASERT
jgi:hypothetical protein